MAAYRDANATAPAHGAVAVTPHDTTVIPITRALYIGGTGAIVVRMADGHDTVNFAAVPVGILSIQVDKVYSTGTGATDIVALY
jgi:hypothetical protein